MRFSIFSNRRDRRAGWAKGAYSDRSRKPAVRRRAGLGVSAQKPSSAASGLSGFYVFPSLVAPISASGPATDGRAVQGMLFSPYRNPRQTDHLGGIFYEAKLSNGQRVRWGDYPRELCLWFSTSSASPHQDAAGGSFSLHISTTTFRLALPSEIQRMTYHAPFRHPRQEMPVPESVVAITG